MSSQERKSDDRSAVAVFGKYPRTGRVKTRLSPFLTEVGCLGFYRALLLDTLERIGTVAADRYLFVSDCSDQERRDLGREISEDLGHAQPIRQQRGRNLGERLWSAYQELSGRYRRVVFLGTDSPTLPPAYVVQALGALKDFPVVLGPTLDGGYYLIGLSQARREVFEGVEWGTSAVLAQTLGKVDRRDVFLLPQWYDVDLPADLVRLEKDVEGSGSEGPRRTARFLTELNRGPVGEMTSTKEGRCGD